MKLHSLIGAINSYLKLHSFIGAINPYLKLHSPYHGYKLLFETI
ncbi:hypothetical protein MC28_G256 (plasmid) [Bacillus thuringiensis MC28]|nr:hypothetical protein MC28_G256 [Bacillus thuringiensis MC28]